MFSVGTGSSRLLALATCFIRFFTFLEDISCDSIFLLVSKPGLLEGGMGSLVEDLPGAVIFSLVDLRKRDREVICLSYDPMKFPNWYCYSLDF